MGLMEGVRVMGELGELGILGILGVIGLYIRYSI